MTRALAMISGGLDSILAAKLIKDQGIEVIGICFKSYFFGESNAVRMCKQIDIPLEVIDFSKEHFEMVKKPKHGYGKNLNPCIDCHAMMMKYSGELLKTYNADFIITGEVLNQRPMSQNKKSLEVVKKESGFSDKILRPLCAKNLDPTPMEVQGLVDREKLMDISGRNRAKQMELAEQWNIVDYPSPAGGCKLTEPNFSERLRDLLSHKENISSEDIKLLNCGRHFRINQCTKIIVARTKEDAEDIKKLLDNDNIIMFPSSHSGAMVVIDGMLDEASLKLAASIAARYSKGKNEQRVVIKYGRYRHPLNSTIEVKPMEDSEINSFIINV